MRDELRAYAGMQDKVEQAAGLVPGLVDLTIAIQQIAAPTFGEGERAAFVEARLRALGLDDVVQDEVNNVYARLPGRRAAPAVMVTAHTDTVFPLETDLSLRRDDAHHRLHGIGVGDNSAGVAALLMIAECLRDTRPPADIWFIANTGEEGLGDLRGMRAAIDRLGDQVGACIVVEGMGLGRVVHQALGSRRYRVVTNAPGGHSWSAFGSPSAVHVLVQLAEKLTRLEAPPHPRTTFNIGRIGGGTSVNSIAESAWLELDLRSEQSATLDYVIDQVQGIVRRFQTAGWRQRGVVVNLETIGNRPTGEIADTHPLVRAAERALVAAGVAVEAGERMSSTDANIPLSRGIPAVCVGLTRGANAHRLDEWVSTLEMGKGLQHLLMLVGWAAGWVATR